MTWLGTARENISHHDIRQRKLVHVTRSAQGPPSDKALRLTTLKITITVTTAC